MNKRNKIKDSQEIMKKLMSLIGKMWMNMRRRSLPLLDILTFLILKPISVRLIRLCLRR